MKNFKIKPLILAVATVSAGIAGCGGTGQDDGVENRVNLSGLGLDGYIARAEVFQDLNKNAVRDAFEPHAYTDDMGYYSYNPTTSPATNYCTSTDEALREKHCLKAIVGDYPILIQGGYDLLTGEPFKGILRKNVNVTTQRSISNIDVVNPITTVLSYVPNNTADQTRAKSLLGITDSDLNRDFYNRDATAFNQSQDDAADLRLLNITQKIHKTVTSASQIVDQVYKVRDEETLPSDTSSYIYNAFTASLLSETDSNTALNNTLSSSNISSILQNARQEIEQSYTSQSVTLPDTTGLSSEILNTNDLTNLTRVGGIVDTLVSSLSTVSTNSDTLGTVKIIDLATSKIANQNTITDINNMIAGIGDNTTLTTIRTELAKPSTSISSLLDIDMSNETEVTNTTTVSYSGELSDLGGKYLRVSESTVASNVRNSEDYSAVLYFVADEGSTTTGTLTACVRYVDGLDADFTLKSGGTLGTHSDKGSWTVLNDGYALMLDFEIAGVNRQATIQFGGEDPNNQGSYIYRTDIDDELRTWSGPAIPEAYNGTVPTNDTECQDALDSLDPMDTTLANAISS